MPDTYKCKLCQENLINENKIEYFEQTIFCKHRHYGCVIKYHNKLEKMICERLVNETVQLYIEYNKQIIEASILIAPIKWSKNMTKEQQSIWNDFVVNGDLKVIQLSNFEGLTKENAQYWYNRLPTFRIFS